MLSPLQRLELLGELKLPPASAVPDALALIEEGVPALGSLLLWSSQTGEVAGGYSSLVGLEDGLAHYVEHFGNTAREQAISGSTFRDEIRSQTRARRFSDILRIPEQDFKQTDVYRVMMRPYGIETIARVVVSHEGEPLGGLALFRGADAAEFSDRALRWMDQAAPLLDRVLWQLGRFPLELATVQRRMGCRVMGSRSFRNGCASVSGIGAKCGRNAGVGRHSAGFRLSGVDG